MKLLTRIGGTGLAALIAAAALTGPAAAQNINVVLNGQTLTFDQPPVMHSSRVFVPMRAIFQQLGSTVVYSNGVINAQGRGRSVHLVIGSTQAQINNQPYTLDVAPFTVAGRTEVPLRFVAQALGANVDWNGNSETVTISTRGGNQSYTPQPSGLTLTRTRPNGVANSTHPALHAEFSQPVNRNSLRVSIDGRDVTRYVYANANGFDVTPNFELYAGRHQVTVSGSTASGQSFSTGWSFRTRASGYSANYINNLSPEPGAQVNSNFTLRGRTLPFSSVHVVATGSASALGGLFQIGTGTFQNDTQAGGNGSFSMPIGINTAAGGHVRVIITSVSPNGESMERDVVYGT